MMTREEAAGMSGPDGMPDRRHRLRMFADDSSGIVCETFSGTADDILGGKDILLTAGKNRLQVKTDEDTVYLYEEDDTVFCVYFRMTAGAFAAQKDGGKAAVVCKAVIGDSWHGLFKDIGDMDVRWEDIALFSRLSPQERERVKRRAAGFRPSGAP